MTKKQKNVLGEDLELCKDGCCNQMKMIKVRILNYVLSEIH